MPVPGNRWMVMEWIRTGNESAGEGQGKRRGVGRSNDSVSRDETINIAHPSLQTAGMDSSKVR